VELLEAIHEQVHVLLLDLLLELEHAALRHVVQEEVQLRDRLGTLLGEDHLVEEVLETFIVDEVGSQGNFLNSRVGVGSESVGDSLDTVLSQSVETQIQELKGLVGGESDLEGSGSVDVDDVSVKIQVFDA
jgi:hypothetical protein